MDAPIYIYMALYMDLMLVAFRRGVAGSLLGCVFGDKFEPLEAAAKTTPGF